VGTVPGEPRPGHTGAGGVVADAHGAQRRGGTGVGLVAALLVARLLRRVRTFSVQRRDQVIPRAEARRDARVDGELAAERGGVPALHRRSVDPAVARDRVDEKPVEHVDVGLRLRLRFLAQREVGVEIDLPGAGEDRSHLQAHLFVSAAPVVVERDGADAADGASARHPDPGAGARECVGGGGRVVRDVAGPPAWAAQAGAVVHPGDERAVDQERAVSLGGVANLVIVGPGQKPALGPPGSVSSVVTADASQSVVCVPPNAQLRTLVSPRVRTTLVATDLSQFANRAVPYAFSLTPADGTVHIVHVIKPDAQADELAIRDQLQQLAPVGATQAVHVHVVRGDEPAVALARSAAFHGADVLCISSHGRTGIARAIVGSVADHLLRVTRLPVLVLRPA